MRKTKLSKRRPKGGRLFSRPSGFSLDAPSVPTAGKERDEPIHTAYCPLHEGLCSDVACESCSLITEEFPDGVWVCTTCTDFVYLKPYYGDGSCHFCGHKSGFLSLGVLR